MPKTRRPRSTSPGVVRYLNKQELLAILNQEKKNQKLIRNIVNKAIRRAHHSPHKQSVTQY
jgi:hypothetical protein